MIHYNPGTVKKVQYRHDDSSAVDELVGQVKIFAGELPLAKVMHTVGPETKSRIISSKKGLEGWIRSLPEVFIIKETAKGKCIMLKDPTITRQKLPEFDTEFVCPPPPVKCGSHSLRPAVDSKLLTMSEELDSDSGMYAHLAPYMIENTFHRAATLFQIAFGRSNTKANSLVAFEKYFHDHPQLFWTTLNKHELWVCKRMPGQSSEKPKKIVFGDVAGISALRTFSEMRFSPTRMAMCLLQYVPIHWHSISFLTPPDEVRSRIIGKKGKITLLLAKEPRYYDLSLQTNKRDVGLTGVVVYRRSPMLHPEAHGMTFEEAQKYVQGKLDEMQANNGKPPILDEIARHFEGSKNAPYSNM